MHASSAVTVTIDLGRVRANAERIARRVGVPLLAVVKADAYGLGTAEVARAVADVVGGFYVFDADEAVDLYRLTGKRTVALNGNWTDPADYRAAHVHPVVWSADRAVALRSARPVLSVDTGQQRFACPPAEAEAVRRAGDCDEAMTHATRPEQVDDFRAVCQKWPAMTLHAAGSALLDDPAAWLSAVRPGLALYAGAVRVTTRLVEVRRSTGPAGYTGFCVPHLGVILAGYRHGLKPGPCSTGGVAARVTEVGMQSAFVAVPPDARVGDEVVLLGSAIADNVSGSTADEDQTVAPTGVNEAAVAAAWKTSCQEVLVRLTAAGRRSYRF